MEKSIKKDLTVILALFLFTCIFFYKAFLNPYKFTANVDFNNHYLMFTSYLINSLNNNQYPLWNSAHFSGITLVGNPQFNLFFPTNLLFLVFRSNFVGLYLFYASYFFVGITTYLCAKSLGLKKGALIAAVTFMFSANLTTKLVGGHNIAILIIIFLPLGFMLLDKLIRTGKRKYMIHLALVVFAMLLTRQLQFFYYSCMGFAMFFLIMSNKDKKFFKRGFMFSSALIIGLMLCAFNLLPILDFRSQSLRGSAGDFQYATSFSLSPRYLITLFIPKFFGSLLENTYWGPPTNFWEGSIYLSILSLILFAVGLRKKSKLSLAFILICVFSLLFALGNHTPFFKLTYLIPGVSIFRAPSRILFLFSFSASIIAGIGFDNLKKQNINKIKKLVGLFCVLGLIVTSAMFLGKEIIMNKATGLARQRYNTLHPGENNFQRDYLPRLDNVFNSIFKGILIMNFFSIASFLILKFKNKLTKKKLLTLCIIVIFLDLFIFGSSLIKHTDPFMQTDIHKFIAQDSEDFRILDLSELIKPNSAAQLGITRVGGYDSTISKKYIEYTNKIMDFEELCPEELSENKKHGACITNLPLIYINISDIKNHKLLDMLNVKYIISREKIQHPELKLAAEFENHIKESEIVFHRPNSDKKFSYYIYENGDYLPRSYLVGNFSIKDDVLKEISKENFKPKEYVVLQDGKFDTEAIKWKEVDAEYSPNQIKTSLNLDSPAFLVLSETYDPGWKAYDNNQEIKILRANYIFRAVYLEAGKHEVVFKYKPKSLIIGGIISIITAVYLLAIILPNQLSTGKK